MLTKEQLEGKYILLDDIPNEEIYNKILKKLKELGLYEDTSLGKWEGIKGYNWLKIEKTTQFNNAAKENSQKLANRIQVSDVLGEESPFEVGKWYKWYQTNHETFHIGKFKELTDSSDSFYMEPWISNNTNYIESGCFTLKFAEQIQELTLEEIQQYLPDNHPDKIVKTIEKWSVGSYVVFCKNNTSKDVLLNKPYEIIKKSLNSIHINIIDEAGNLSITNYTSTFYIIKWFATLSEAEAFSKSLLKPEESKPLTVDDLVEGEVYVAEYSSEGQYINLSSGKYAVNCYIDVKDKKYLIKSTTCGGASNYRIATPEEKKWLNVCIAEDKFVEKEVALRDYDMYGKALKSEVIPEYVELLKGWSQDEEFVGEIFDTKQDFQEQFKKFKGIGHSWNWNFILTEPNHKKYFKESTKAAYDAQFKKEMKEDFKVGDYVITDGYTDKYDGRVLRITKFSDIYPECAFFEIFDGGDYSSGHNFDVKMISRKATLEEIAKVTKPKTKPFEFNKWYKSNNADGLFFIQSERTGYGFRSNHINYWFTNNDDFGWNIDGLEPATIEEIKERLLSYAKEKYPIGTKFKCITYDKEFTVTNPNYMDNANGFRPDDDSTIWIGVKEQCSGKIFDGKGKWAEIISKPETKESKEFDRNWYVEVSSQEEANAVFDYLEAQGERVGKGMYRTYRQSVDKFLYFFDNDAFKFWAVNHSGAILKPTLFKKQLSDILGDNKPYKLGDITNKYSILSIPDDFKWKLIPSFAVESKPEPRVKLINVPKI